MEDFKELIGSDTKMVFITAGLGGGTGTGAAPVLAEACRALDILTVGIVTLPFSFEGKKRLEQAEDGLRELRQFCDTTLVISNDKVRELFGNLVFKEAFAKADDVLASAAKGIAEIITVDGYVNVDFADVKTVLHRSGKAVMGNGQASGENRAIEAVRMALSSPLLSENDISGARNILINLSSGLDDPIRLDEIGEVNDYVQTEAGAGTDVIWGNCTDETLGDAMRVTLIATGFEGQNNRNYGPAKGSTATASGFHTENPSPVKVHQLDAMEAMVEQPKLSELDPKEALEATRKMLEKEWTFSEPVAAEPAAAEPADHSEQAWKEDQENLPLFTVIDEGPSTDLQSTVDAEPSERNLFSTVWTLEDQPSSKSEDQGSALDEPKAQEDGAVEAEINPFFGYDGTVEWDLAVDEPTLASTPTQAAPLVEDKVQEVYATGPNEDDVLTRSRQRIQNLRKLNSLINAPGMPSLEELEKVPAYVRAGYQPDRAPGSAEMPLSRTSIGTGQGNSGIIQTGNRYLHDNVD
jgi:cell division protein FtsZ